MSIAGVIIYKINRDGSLDGRWTHPEFNGLTGTERAIGGTPGRIEGKYNVEIYDPGNSAMFRGTLDIAPIGAAYSLTWVGMNLPEGDSHSRYSGIGLVESNSMLVACFQESAP